jgi:transposase
MITIHGNPRLFICRIPMSMRKNFEGLSSAVEEMFPGELLSGAYFIFLNRQRNYMKVLYWDVDGLAIWSKRLEMGTFAARGTHQSISRKEFLMLLEGVVPKRVHRRYSL